jgi:tetratricopeptide (TPR) repeat protein
MEPIEPPNTWRLAGTVGWLELGNVAEARAEFAQLPDSVQAHPDVLEVRWLLCQAEEDWEGGLRAARALVEAAPKRPSGWLHLSYALRRAPDGGVQKAFEALRPAFEKFPKEPTISYNLSCYACQMRQLEEARGWLRRAMAISNKEVIKKMALADSDLEALWAEIRGW